MLQNNSSYTGDFVAWFHENVFLLSMSAILFGFGIYYKIKK